MHVVKVPLNEEKKQQINAVLPKGEYRCPQICSTCLQDSNWFKPDPRWKKIVCEPFHPGIQCHECAKELEVIKAIENKHPLKEVKKIFLLAPISHFKHLWTEERTPAHNSVRFGSQMQKAIYFREKDGEIYVKMELCPRSLRWGFAVKKNGEVTSMLYKKKDATISPKFSLLTKFEIIPEKLFGEKFQLEPPPERPEDYDFSNIKPKLRHRDKEYFEKLLTETAGVDRLVVECFATFSLHWTQTEGTRKQFFLDNIPHSAPDSVKALKKIFQAIVKYKSPLFQIGVDGMKEISFQQLREIQKQYFGQALWFYLEACRLHRGCDRKFDPWVVDQWLYSNIAILSLAIHEFGLQFELGPELRAIFGDDADLLEQTKVWLGRGNRKHALKSFGCLCGDDLTTEIAELEGKVEDLYTKHEAWKTSGAGYEPKKISNKVETICHWLVLMMNSKPGGEKEDLRERGLKWVKRHLAWIRKNNTAKKQRKLREMEMLSFKLWFENA